LVLCMTLLSLILPGESILPSPPTTLDIPNTISPLFLCSAFCMYEINPTTLDLVSLCSQDYNVANPEVFGNGYCTKCDPLLFRAVLNTVTTNTYYCIPHEYNSESTITTDNKIWDIPLGYYIAASPRSWTGTYSTIVSTLRPHYAIRVRFSIYMYMYYQAVYDYPLQYNMDSTVYNYHQVLDKYWSPYDIITSSQQKHTDNQVTLTFSLKDSNYGLNTDINCANYLVSNGGCYCLYSYSCSGFSYSRCTAYTDCGVYHPDDRTCCYLRYIQITDVILFTTNCQTGCSSCTSSTNCIMCDISNPLMIYYRCPLDNLCYLTCPQATFKDNTTLFLNAAGYNQI
jgi:hypothetical protein